MTVRITAEAQITKVFCNQVKSSKLLHNFNTYTPNYTASHTWWKFLCN